MDKTVPLTRDEGLVLRHLGETDKTVFLLTMDEALVLRYLGEMDKTFSRPGTRPQCRDTWGRLIRPFFS